MCLREEIARDWWEDCISMDWNLARWCMGVYGGIETKDTTTVLSLKGSASLLRYK